MHNVHILNSDVGNRVELHVELPGEMPFGEAYDSVKTFEAALHAACPLAEVVSHLEPEIPPGEAGNAVSEPMFEMFQKEIQAVVDREPLVANPHNFIAYMLPEQGICIAFHCVVTRGLTVQEAHAVSTRIERQLHLALPVVGRIVIHMEPGVSSSQPSALPSE